MTGDDYKRLADFMNVGLLIENGLPEPLARRIGDQWKAKCEELAVLRAASVKAGEVVACDHPLEARIGSGSVNSDGSGHTEWRCNRCGYRYRADYPPKGTAPPAPTASVGAMQPWPKALNVTRAGYNSWHGDISFAERPTDDELAALHDFLRANHKHRPALAADQSDGGEQPNATTIAAIEELERGDGITSGSMYGDYTPVTVRASATPPAPTPSAARALPANRIWFDTEFIEDGTTIDLISIGMVRSDGATYYAETDQWIPGKASQWVKDNVIVHLKGGDCIKPRDVIAREIVAFAGENPEFWAYYADYDWVALCQLFGTMMQLPDGWPMFCRDIKQRAVDLGNPKLPEQTSTEHHALADALWNKEAWDFLALLPDEAAIRAAAFEEAAGIADKHNYGSGDNGDWTANKIAAAIRAAGEK